MLKMNKFFIGILFFLCDVYCASSSSTKVFAIPEPQLSPPEYVVGPPGEIPEGYESIKNEFEARKAAVYLELPFDKDPLVRSARSNFRPDDPHGALFRRDEANVYFNIYKDEADINRPPNRKSIYKRIESPRGQNEGKDIPRLITSTGLLYHAFGYDQGTMRPWRYPEEVLNYWKSNGGLYQQSATYVDDYDNILATPVGILIDPEDPKVTIHLMGAKDLYYWPAVKKYPSAGRVDQACSQGQQGLAEASRAAYNAFNWRYVSFINGCYSSMIEHFHSAMGSAMKVEDDVRFFLGSPVRALKETRLEEEVLHSLGEAPRRSRKGVECSDCLWNEAIFSAPVESIIGVINWAGSDQTPISEEAPRSPRNEAGFWFKLACQSVKSLNPSTKCFHVFDKKLYESLDGTTAESEEYDSWPSARNPPGGIATGQVPEILEDMKLLRSGIPEFDSSGQRRRSESKLSTAGYTKFVGFALSTVALFLICIIFFSYSSSSTVNLDMSNNLLGNVDSFI